MTFDLCSEGQKKKTYVQADATGEMVRADGKGDKEEPTPESFVNQAKEYELYFGCFGEPLKDFKVRLCIIKFAPVN